MSEEEILERVKQVIQDSKDRYWLRVLIQEDIWAIQGLLDLYKEEKEKNEELKYLIEHQNGYVHILEQDLFENCSNLVIPKDKIRSKIKELEGIRETFTDSNGILEISVAIDTLKELLEEE